MRKLLLISILYLNFLSLFSQDFDQYFEDRTLRLDYTFSGDHQNQSIYVDELISLPRWYGKRQHLSEVPLRGNGQIIVRIHGREDIIYRHSFSSLF